MKKTPTRLSALTAGSSRIRGYQDLLHRVVPLRSSFQIALEDADMNTRLVGGLRMTI
jgi:hypothetical protein